MNADSQDMIAAGWLTLGELSREVSKRSRRRVYHTSVAAWLPTALGHLKSMLVDKGLVDRPTNWSQRTLYDPLLVELFVGYMDERVFGQRVDVIRLTRMTRSLISEHRGADEPQRLRLVHDRASA